ncbi:hypothetical protein F8388_023030 [Cannabis sativa]|uniref:Cation/H+ exchanger domain-containing protein n=1 Tax=Cannabis sativa TaxID=3483 RepID=A0A7J6FEP1_CANSA|nr:hypothetical protein F8388_023030 [Cannabis sativa]
MATPVGNTIIGIRGAPITCVKEDMNRNYRGIWYGDSPFNFVFPTVLAKVIVITLISRGLFVLLRPLKHRNLSAMFWHYLRTIIIGGIPIVKATLYQPRETELFRTLAIIGGLYAVFPCGSKDGLISYSKVCKEQNHYERTLCFLRALVSILHFFPVVAEALEELNLMNTELGQLAMSSAMLNDFIFWFFLGLSVAFKQDTISHSIRAMFSFIVLAIFTFTVVRGRIKFKSAILLSLIMNIKGLLELINLHRWIFSTMNKLHSTSFVTLGVTMIVTPLIDILSRSRTRLDLSCRNRGLRTLCSMPKNTEFRILCCVHDEESVHSLITLLEASNPIESSSICTYLVQTSELIGLAAPLLVPYDKKRRKLKLAFSASTDQIIRAFENYAKNSRGPVMILPFIMVASYKTMHESVCRLAQEKFIPLIILPFQLNTATAESMHIYASSTPTSKPTLHAQWGSSWTRDSRAALAYATRMSDNRMTVTVTVLRIILLRNVEEEESQEATEKSSDEAALDELVVEEFKIKNIGSLALRPGDGGETEELVAMMMGDDEMMDFVENEELGLIGDMLASSDFCGGKVSVLVMQHYREGVTTTRSGSNKSLIEKVQLLTRHASR